MLAGTFSALIEIPGVGEVNEKFGSKGTGIGFVGG
jgi:hypothetical protein